MLPWPTVFLIEVEVYMSWSLLEGLWVGVADIANGFVSESTIIGVSTLLELMLLVRFTLWPSLCFEITGWLGLSLLKD